MSGIVSLIYLIVGAVVAQQHAYFVHLRTLAQVLSAALGVVLWPLVLVGANLHVHLG